MLTAIACSPAAAHIAMSFPEPREEAQKTGPCGSAVSTRGSTVNTFQPGETITVRWLETIDHRGFFRVAFDVAGNDALDFDGGELGRLTDPAGGNDEWSLDVTLPDTPCSTCTLQLIQDMTGGTYFQCADLVLLGPDGLPPPPPEPTGCSALHAAQEGPPITALAALGALLLLRLRRRRS